MKIAYFLLFVSTLVCCVREVAMSAGYIPERPEEHWWLAGVWLFFVAPIWWNKMVAKS